MYFPKANRLFNSSDKSYGSQNLTVKLDSVNTISPLQKTVIWDQKGKRRNHSIRLNPSQGPLRYLPSSKVFLNYVIVFPQRAHSCKSTDFILFLN